MIKKLGLSIACCLLASLGAAHAVQNEGRKVGPELEHQIRLGAIEDRQKWYDALRQELNEDDQLYDQNHRKITVAIHPTFDDIWLIAIESYPEVAVQRTETLIVNLPARTEIRVSKLSQSSINDGKLIEPWHDTVKHKRIIKDFYSKPMSKAEFDEIFTQLSSVINSESIISDQDSGCTDGTTLFAEVLMAGQHRLISRHNCDRDYPTVLRGVYPLFEIARAKIQNVRSELQDVLKAETGEASTLK